MASASRILCANPAVVLQFVVVSRRSVSDLADAERLPCDKNGGKV